MVPGLEFSDASGKALSRKRLRARWRAMPLGMQIATVLMLICMALPLATLLIIWYIMWYLPLRLLRKKSAVERGRQPEPAPDQPRRGSTVPPPFVPEDGFQLVITGLDVHSRPIVERRRRRTPSNTSMEDSILSPRRGKRGSTTSSQESLLPRTKTERSSASMRPPVPAIPESKEPSSPSDSTTGLPNTDLSVGSLK